LEETLKERPVRGSTGEPTPGGVRAHPRRWPDFYCKRSNGKTTLGSRFRSTDLLKSLPARAGSQQPKHNSIFRAAAQEQEDTATGASPLPHTKCPLPVCIPVAKAPRKMTARQKPRPLLIVPHPGDSKGKGNSAAHFRPQVAVISSS